MRVELSDRLYGILDRIAVSLESIDQTLKGEDFTSEDQTVIDATRKVQEAKDRIPHGT